VKPKFRPKLPKMSKNLKLQIFSQIIYGLALSSSFTLVITFLVAEKFSGTLTEIGLIFIALYFPMSLTSYFTRNRLNWVNPYVLTIIGMFMLFLSAILVIISISFIFVLVAFLIEGIGAGIWGPSNDALRWSLTPKENRERVAGWVSGWRGFASGAGPLLGGFLVTIIGVTAPFYFKAVISLISLSIYFYLFKSLKKQAFLV